MVIMFSGYRDVDYKSKDGRAVRGSTVFGLLQDCDDKNVVGRPCFEQYVSNFDASTMVEGSLYEVLLDVTMFNGKPQARVVGFREV